MSITTDHVRWYAGIRDYGGYGLTHGDTVHQGKRNYDSVLPCPNGLEVRDTKPREHEAWRRRVDKARSDIATHTEHIEWRKHVEEVHGAWTSNDVSGLIDFIERCYA